jgi:hypothetical protein
MKQLFAKSLLAAATAAGLFTLPTTAQAGDRYGYDRHRHDRRDEFRIDVRTGGRRDDDCEPRKVWVEPVYEERAAQVWVEPVYRTESVPVFVAERCETKCERVWVEPVYEVREVVRYERGRRYCSRERVCVRPGGWQTVERKVVIPAHYRHEDRQVLVCAGHYETRRDRVCVREGRWETVAVDRPRYDRDRWSVNLDLRGKF